MNTFPMKTFANSYLYNAVAKNADKANNKAITDFIIKSVRIDKEDKAFIGVAEDVKRQQTSSVLVSILYNPNVVLCINDAPMPRAFSVFDAKDPKDGNRPKVFIDVTGRIEFKDGYYILRRSEIDKFCSLLFDAMIYLLYRNDRVKLCNNATITLTATTCYVLMFDYVIDYLRVIGFRENKNKISYLIALYFLVGMIGYPLDDYSKQVAAKIAGINPREAAAYTLYIDDPGMFENIGTFLPSLVNIFKLKGLDLPTFISRWIKSFGIGTEYATEVYTSFLCVVVNAYTGSYIINQKQIEVACGDNNIVKLANAILKVGSSTYDLIRTFANEETLEKLQPHSKIAQEMATALANKSIIESTGFSINDFSDKDKAINEARNIVKSCNDAKIADKIGIYAEKVLEDGINAAYISATNLLESKDSIYEAGTLASVAKVFKNTLSDRQRHCLETTIDRDINHLAETIRESGAPKDISSDISKTILEFRELKQYL